MKENGYMHKKIRSRQYPAEIIIYADYTDDLELLTNTPVQAESMQHSLEQASGGTGLHVNANKTVYVF